ncbi:MAG TPA: hypothetical protein VGL29_14680, partial [Blastocatellia bacterium]
MNAELEVEPRAAVEPAPTRAALPLARHARNITLILLAIVALFWRVCFLGETLVDVNTLNNQLPWGYYAGPSDYPYNRRDLTDTYVTREYFVVSAYRDGEFPLWNPYTMAGHPIYADGVTRTLSPFLLFYKFFDVPLGYSLARISELALAIVFMYAFLVAIGASANGALMGSLVFGFSAHSMFHLTGLGWWGGLMWLPLILLFADRAIIANRHAGSLYYAMLAGVFLALQFFCGYLPNAVYYVGAVVLYYLFFAIFRGRGDSAPRIVLRRVAMMIVTLAVGLALSATQWAPSLELLSYSNRKIVGAELGYVWLPPWYAATLVFPNLFGSAYDARMLTLFTGIGVSHDHILYLGIAALVPLCFSVYWLRRNIEGLDPACLASRNRMVFFVILASISLFLMMAAPLYVPVTRYIPILQVIRVAVRAGVLFLFAAAALVAFGVDMLLASTADVLQRFHRHARNVAISVTGCLLLVTAGSYLLRASGFSVDPAQRGRTAFIGRAALALSAEMTPPRVGIVLPLIFIVLVVVALWAFAKGLLPRKAFFALLTALLVLDLYWDSTQFDHSFDRARVFPKTEITDLMRSLPPGRVLVVPSELETNRSAAAGSATEKIIAPPNTLLPYRISTVTGKNQQFPKWYREFASLIEPQPNLSHVVFDTSRSPLFDLLNVRYAITHESTPVPGYKLLRQAEGVSLYENVQALPRAFFVSHIIDASSHEEALNILQDRAFDPRKTAVIEDAGPTFAALAQRADELHSDLDKPSSGVARIVEDKRNRVAVETENQSAETLVLSDNDYPGWRAFVDGLPVHILRANCTMRAVNVPAGR